MEFEKTREFDVLGYRVKLAESSDSASATPEEIVEMVRQEAGAIQNRNPNLNRGQVAVLVALKLATDKTTINREFKESVHLLEGRAQTALREIEQLTLN